MDGAPRLAPVAAGFVVGLVNGVLIARARMAPFIVTLAALLGLKGLALVLARQDLLIANSGFFARVANVGRDKNVTTKTPTPRRFAPPR
ncbi:hypothetical protein [Paraburkholderia unamae]|uniref:Uncharacterized protein n=1 Tax=Paraburkholderia unamae TaxID=219649 RepID=A0ACC6RX74_9BURK